MKEQRLLFFSIITLVFIPKLLSAQFLPKNGDLLFQDLNCGSFCTAINKVTKGVDGRGFAHIGIVVRQASEIYVMEAISKGAVLTPLDSFLARSTDTIGNPMVLVGRVILSEKQIYKAVQRGLSMIGRPYDDVFDINNEALYCSELVYFSFRDEYEQSIFDLAPMTFIDPDSNKTFHLWEEYYKNLGEEIPEGKPGINPGGISLSPFVEVVYDYQKP